MTTTAPTTLDNLFATPVTPRAPGAAPLGDAEGAILLARRFPRDQREAFERIIAACRRAGLARTGLYSYSRGGSDISGPSIRLAEAIAQNWGNIQFGIQELEQQGGESTVKAYAWDVETNTRQEKVFRVPHRRVGRQGPRRAEDGRDIYEAVANQGARRLRACILGVVPGDVVEAAVEQCEETLAAAADLSPAALARLAEAFAACGVTREQVAARLGCPLEAATPAQAVQLGKIRTSLHDGMSKPGDWFEPVGEQAAPTAPSKKGAAGLKERLRSGSARNQALAAKEG
ncbi:hypothetical protein [Oryzomonas japonica]|uniref:hypothetical protein n=1 Tax=Oryzomonas japonica TaxID=2603858 RepID=UPI0017875CCE|nr:hypothetical protein [Oryzomonas japonica]